jgi:phosphoenolpyruvate carboxylase
MPTDQTLRREIDHLGRLFGEVIRQFDGDDAFELVEEVRRQSRALQDDTTGEHRDLDKLLSGLDADQLETVIRAFSTFLELANLAEDRQRVRALRSWERDAHPAPRKESIRAAVMQLAASGMSRSEIADALGRIHVELVFTAHPTEAKRQSLRERLRQIRNLLAQLDSTRKLPREEHELSEQVRREIVKLWQTDSVRSMRPTVLQEVQRGLSFQPVLWETVPRIFADLREALTECFPGEPNNIPPLLKFGSWMGGDRDGHPYVTPHITRQTCLWLRHAALTSHHAQCTLLGKSLSLADHCETSTAPLREAVQAAVDRWPAAADVVETIAPAETFRKWLAIVRWRIEQTLEEVESVEYGSPNELARDVKLLADALIASGNHEIAHTELQQWLDQIEVFGFHTARLDIREHSEVYSQVLDEIWRAARLVAAGETIDESRRLALLSESMPYAENIDPVQISPEARKTLELFTVLRRLARRYGMQALGGHVVSMTRSASDLLSVLWLWRWSQRVDGGDERDSQLLLPVIPLFETIDDLQHAPQILSTALSTAAYRDHVAQLGNKQIAMLGYSDSTKDGGYLAAGWSLQRSQIELYRLAKEFGVALTFFHGRGGSLGRGGGPAARAILSLPRETFHGSLRLTEQGEVLAERYDDPSIAHRHLEQVLWSIMMATTQPPDPLPEVWLSAMDNMAAASLDAYHQLVNHDAFVDFFRQATPISEIEQLPIGSRPAKRKGGNRIQDLRAIPWVFSWTQARCLLPAWYGLGTALEQLLSTPDGSTQLQDMYRQWPFFRAMVDNSVLAVAKSNLPVFRRYVALAEQTPELAAVADMLFAEFDRASKNLAVATGCDELLDNVDWLKRSIKVRNRYVDPLNMIQVELLRREKTASDGDQETLRRLAQLAIKGIAAGMRTTG